MRKLVFYYYDCDARRYESELIDLRQQLKQALAEEKEIAEEVERYLIRPHVLEAWLVELIHAHVVQS
jgi:hypothetical protein